MTESLHKKTSNFFITLFIAVITISFMFTGIQSFQGSPDTMAQVGDTSIKIVEFNRAFKNQLEFYKRFSGGKDLTNAQIKQFNLRENALNALIQNKLLIQFGNKISGEPANDQVKKDIKGYKAFLENDQFNIQRYKILLRRNRMTPIDFEKSIQDQITSQFARETLEVFPLSSQFAQDILDFKAQKVNLSFVKINKQGLDKFIPVTQVEIKTFLETQTNQARVESIFESRKLSWNTPKKIKARHILLKSNGKNDAEIAKRISTLAKKITPKNFIQMAKKYTEEPGGKAKGGSLGFFSKGKMVPEFEKMAFSLKEQEISPPVKTQFGQHIIFIEKIQDAKIAQIKDHQNELAKELLQKERSKELDQLVNDLKSKIEMAMKENDTKELLRLKNKYQFQYSTNISINKYDGAAGKIQIKSESIDDIFKNFSHKKFFLFDSPTDLSFVKVLIPKELRKDKTKKEKNLLNEELKTLTASYGQTFSKDFIAEIKGKTKIKIFKNLLQ